MFCFVLFCFGCESYVILAPHLEIELTLPAMEGEELTAGPPGKSLAILSWMLSLTLSFGI